MDEMKDRVKQVRKDAAMTREAFAERIGMTANSIYMIEAGLRGASPAAVREICRQFAVREEWLRTGEGEMHRDLSPALEAAERVRRLLVDAPNSTAGRVISALVALDPAGPEWDTIGSLLRQITAPPEH